MDTCVQDQADKINQHSHKATLIALSDPLQRKERARMWVGTMGVPEGIGVCSYQWIGYKYIAYIYEMLKNK